MTRMLISNNMVPNPALMNVPSLVIDFIPAVLEGWEFGVTGKQAATKHDWEALME